MKTILFVLVCLAPLLNATSINEDIRAKCTGIVVKANGYAKEHGLDKEVYLKQIVNGYEKIGVKVPINNEKGMEIIEQMFNEDDEVRNGYGNLVEFDDSLGSA